MDVLGNISIAGWISIVIISLLIFIILMVRGIKLGWGDKNIQIGKRLESRFDTLKKEMELENIKKANDERYQKMLFKKSMEKDNYLFAQLVKNIKKMDGDIYKIFEPFVQCQFPSLVILDIFEDVLMERVYFNNIKEKLTKDNKKSYIDDVVVDIKNAYISFYTHLKSLHCGENYPEWDKIEESVNKLIIEWAIKCIEAYIENVCGKIEMYKRNAKRFKTEEFKRVSINYPLKKNKKYLSLLNESIMELKKNVC